MAKVLIDIDSNTDTLIDDYQTTYRELNGKKISRSDVINKVFLVLRPNVEEMTGNMKEIINQKESTE